MITENIIEKSVNNLSENNSFEFKILQKVSSFKYEPLKNAKSITVHPYYEKYLKKSSEKSENINPIQNKIFLNNINIFNKSTPVNLLSKKVKNTVIQKNINNYIESTNIQNYSKYNTIFTSDNNLLIEKQLEFEKQKQLELERQKQLEFEKQKQLELEKENKINLEYIEDLKKNKEYKQKQLDIIEFNKITEKSYITNTIISKQPEKINKLKNFDSYLHYCTSTILLKNKVIPLVTIIVPMYNVELYINNCIISLLNQSYDNIEIILVDDCSIDNTKKIADDFGEKYPLKIKVIHNQKNMGTYKSINNGIVISSGEYITIIGADDQFTVNKVEKQVKILISNLNYVACFCEYKRIHYITKKVLLKNVGESTIMFRRKIIEKIGYYDSVRFGADSEYYDRIKAVYGKNRTFIIKNVLYLALYRPNSLISSGISIDGSIFRSDYIKKYSNWHNICKNLYIEYPLQNRPFEVANELL